jgi:hypothetical protein
LNYPREFSIQSKARIEAALIKARTEFGAAKENSKWDERINLRQDQAFYFRNVFFAFAMEACSIKAWSVDRIAKEVTDAVDSIAREVQRECGHVGFKSDWMFDRDNHPSEELWVNLKSSGAWTLYEERRSEIAHSQASEPEPSQETLLRAAKESLAMFGIGPQPLPGRQRFVPETDNLLHKLKSLRKIVVDLDTLLLEAGPEYKVPLSQCATIKKILEQVAVQIPAFDPAFECSSEPPAMRAPLRDAIWKLEYEIDILDQKGPHTPEPPVTEAVSNDLKSTGAFPNRAAWLKERLRERAWDRNDVFRLSGPDVKTVQKILDGKYVRPGGLEKLVTALNHKKFKNAS